MPGMQSAFRRRLKNERLIKMDNMKNLKTIAKKNGFSCSIRKMHFFPDNERYIVPMSSEYGILLSELEEFSKNDYNWENIEAYWDDKMKKDLKDRIEEKNNLIKRYKEFCFDHNKREYIAIRIVRFQGDGYKNGTLRLFLGCYTEIELR